MGDWMTVTITGNIDPADAPAARAFINIGEDWNKFHCLAYYGPSLCGLGPWMPPDGGQINAIGNLSERNYTTKHVADALRQLVAIAPSLTLKVHCGGPYESKQCTATVTAWRGNVTVGPPEVQTVGDRLETLATMRLSRIMFGDPDDEPAQLKSPDCPACGHPPKLLVSSAQAFCGNDECNAFCWNPSETPGHQRAHQTHTTLTDTPTPTTEQ
ncbi:MAG TPA: hypothetical protein DGT23_19535 [Micromonosporaceae bacterium]|nr:hypothetical protein [Micromonosporaceae bacterium]